MATLPPRGGPHFGVPAHDLLAKLSDRQLSAVSGALSKMFSDRMALSTLYDGSRQNQLTAEASADLKDLETALPEGTITLDNVMRDRFGAEPRMLAFLRQIEGHPSQALALLCSQSDEAADEAIAEARAMGYGLVPGERMVALMPPSKVEILDKLTGDICFGAGCDWDMLNQAAVTAGLCCYPTLSASYDSPLAAAKAGIFGSIREIRRFGLSWRIEAQLPPLSRSPATFFFIFPESEQAECALSSLARDIAPLFVETFPASDVLILAAAKLAAAHKWLKNSNACVLGITLEGPHIIQNAGLKYAESIISRHGGRRVWPRGLPARAELEAILAACGAARLVRPANMALPIPEDARTQKILHAVRGKIEAYDCITYLRDLSTSLTEAQRVLGLIEDPSRAVVPDLAEQAEESARAHG